MYAQIIVATMVFVQKEHAFVNRISVVMIVVNLSVLINVTKEVNV